MRGLGAGILVMAGCMLPAAPSDDAARLRPIMGLCDRLKLEIQLLTAEPDPDREIDARIARLERLIREASRLRPLPDPAANDRLPGLSRRALEDLAALRGATWRPATREAHWQRLETACAVCHSQVR